VGCGWWLGDFKAQLVWKVESCRMIDYKAPSMTGSESRLDMTKVLPKTGFRKKTGCNFKLG